LALQLAGHREPLGLDRHFTQQAKSQGMEVRELETLEPIWRQGDTQALAKLTARDFPPRAWRTLTKR
jgi:uncharacterized protein YbaP (TraB family)